MNALIIIGIFAGVWIFLGIIALILGCIFLNNDDEKLTFSNALIIIILGFIGLLGVFEDIGNKYPSI